MVRATTGEAPQSGTPAGDPCLMVIFGASGDLTKRLLMPAFFNLACDGLLPQEFAIAGIALDDLNTDSFRARMTDDIKKFSTRQTFEPEVWKDLAERLYYTPGNFGDPAAYQRLGDLMSKLEEQYQTKGNTIFYLAVPPPVFGLISENLAKSGLKQRQEGWTRIIVEKPFGHDLKSAEELNRTILTYWSEEQVYRIDHYLGKETVQNLLAFRFSNGMFEPLWNKDHIDHIQMTVSETVGVETRGKYYDQTGVLRDMIQNHMFQMLAYVCMEPPSSFKPDAVRNEKAKLLEAVRVYSPAEVAQNCVRGQYGPGKQVDGSPLQSYRESQDVNPQSWTETYAALRLYIDNWRWEGVPVYLRSGKALWKRGTEIMVQFKKAPEVIFRGTPARERLESNRLFFHIQPDQGIEIRFHAKTPGPSMLLQKVNMRFDYKEAFEASRGTGYEVLLYNAMIGDATLFSRTDLVETAWRVAQPMLDLWSKEPPADFPNYPAGSWGPKSAFDLVEQDGRHWLEVISREFLEVIPIFHGCDPVFLRNVAMMLKSDVYNEGDTIVRKGDVGREMFILSRGQVEVVDGDKQVAVLNEGSFFGEMSLLLAQPRVATIRALSNCDVFVLEQGDFNRVLQDHPQFADMVREVARKRFPGALPAAPKADAGKPH
jgi:glucose-6-phosphate 1-dehydrogenase